MSPSCTSVPDPSPDTLALMERPKERWMTGKEKNTGILLVESY